MAKKEVLVPTVGQKIRFVAVDAMTAVEYETDGTVVGNGKHLKLHRPNEFGEISLTEEQNIFWVRDEINPEKNFAVELRDVIKIYDSKKEESMKDSETKTLAKEVTKLVTGTKVAKPAPKKKAKAKAKTNGLKQSILRCKLFDGIEAEVKALMKKEPKTSKSAITKMVEKKFPNEPVSRFFGFYVFERMGLRKNASKLKANRPEKLMVEFDLAQIKKQ